MNTNIKMDMDSLIMGSFYIYICWRIFIWKNIVWLNIVNDGEYKRVEEREKNKSGELEKKLFFGAGFLQLGVLF